MPTAGQAKEALRNQSLEFCLGRGRTLFRALQLLTDERIPLPHQIAAA